jgi:hypothetical protein
MRVLTNRDVARDLTAEVAVAAWIEPDAHVSTVGPRAGSADETPRELADGAAIVAGDSPDLGRLVAEAPQRAADAIALYCSTGPAGSEVVIADAVLRRG